jgi:hypothetical protein
MFTRKLLVAAFAVSLLLSGVGCCRRSCSSSSSSFAPPPDCCPTGGVPSGYLPAPR